MLKKKTRKPRKTLEQKTTQELVKVADEWFSKSIRLRDSDFSGDGWYGVCVSCSYNRKVAYIDETGKLRFCAGWDAGHYVKRGEKVVRFNDENVNLQCKFHCNKMLSGNVEKYRLALMDKYGAEVPDTLTQLARDTQYYKFSKPELLEIVHDSKESIAFYETQTISSQ